MSEVNIVVVGGCGHVGLPFGMVLADRGFRVQLLDVDKAKVDAASARLTEQVGREMLNAYLATLKAKADVKINQANLEKKN